MPKLKFVGIPCISSDAAKQNRLHSQTLGLPPVQGLGRLAVVGGGPSTSDHLHELRSWDGDIWAVNGAAQWCLAHGIDCAMVTIHPGEFPLAYAEGITRAVISDECEPALFDVLKSAKVSIFETLEHGPTTATAIPCVAFTAGFTEITFFGCESSYGTTSHLYGHPLPVFSDTDFEVRVGREIYRTKMDFFMQALYLAELIEAFPDRIKEKSGGLLRSLILDPEDWDILAVSKSIWAQIEKQMAA